MPPGPAGGQARRRREAFLRRVETSFPRVEAGQGRLVRRGQPPSFRTGKSPDPKGKRSPPGVRDGTRLAGAGRDEARNLDRMRTRDLRCTRSGAKIFALPHTCSLDNSKPSPNFSPQRKQPRNPRNPVGYPLAALSQIKHFPPSGHETCPLPPNHTVRSLRETNGITGARKRLTRRDALETPSNRARRRNLRGHERTDRVSTSVCVARSNCAARTTLTTRAHGSPMDPV